MPDVAVILAELVHRPEWHREAACRGADPALFFPERWCPPARCGSGVLRPVRREVGVSGG